MQNHYTGSVSTLGSRVATLRLIGGRPCLDLVNTVSWRGDATRLEDHLTDRSDCLVWCQRAGVISATEAHDLEGIDVRAPLLALRETLTAHLADVDLPRLRPLQPRSATPCSTAPWSRSMAGWHGRSGPSTGVHRPAGSLWTCSTSSPTLPARSDSAATPPAVGPTSTPAADTGDAGAARRTAATATGCGATRPARPAALITLSQLRPARMSANLIPTSAPGAGRGSQAAGERASEHVRSER